MSSKIQRIVIGLLALQIIACTPTFADSILDITPDTGASGFRLGGPISQVETMSWSQSSTYTGVNIDALAGSIDGNPEVISAYLSTSIGPSATSADLVASANVTAPAYVPGTPFSPLSIFTNLTLGPGNYYLTLFNPDTTGNVHLVWGRSTSTPVFGSGVSSNGEFFATTIDPTPGVSVNTATPWQSSFDTSPYYDFAMTVDGSPVPSTSVLPATIVLLLFGLALQFRNRFKVA